ncbi:MAG: LamG domain-containing protein, partial [Cyclobacteriaceae bacterium]|nr:LamG domain-containing protein [Cyclobacteriaceae bacterium]
MKKLTTIVSLTLLVGSMALGQAPTVYLPLNDDLKDVGPKRVDAVDAGTAPVEFVNDAERGRVAYFAEAAHAQFPLIADAPELDFGTGSFSFSFWIKIDPNVPIPSDPAIFSNKDWGSGGNQGFLVALDGADDPASHWWTINAADGAGGRLDWDADDNQCVNLKDGKWHMVAAVFERGAKLNVYVDGLLYQNDPAVDSYDLTLLSASLSPADLPLTIMQD